MASSTHHGKSGLYEFRIHFELEYFSQCMQVSIPINLVYLHVLLRSTKSSQRHSWTMLLIHSMRYVQETKSATGLLMFCALNHRTVFHNETSDLFTYGKKTPRQPIRIPSSCAAESLLTMMMESHRMGGQAFEMPGIRHR